MFVTPKKDWSSPTASFWLQRHAKLFFEIHCSSVCLFGEAFSLWCGTNYFFALPLGFDQRNEAVPRVSIFVEVLMPGCIASEPRCGRGIGDHGAGQYRSLRHAGSEKKLVYAD